MRKTLECSHKGILYIRTLQSHTKTVSRCSRPKHIYIHIFSHFYLCLSFHSHISQTDGNGDPDEVQLDAEMEKVFAGPDRDKDKFDVSQLTSVTEGKSTNVATKFQDHDVDGGYFSIFFYYSSASHDSRKTRLLANRIIEAFCRIKTCQTSSSVRLCLATNENIKQNRRKTRSQFWYICHVANCIRLIKLHLPQQ